MALVTDLITALNQAAADAAANGGDATSKANAAKTANDTTPSCMEGLNKLDEARTAALTAHDNAGEAKGIWDALNQLSVLAIIGNTPTANQMADATTKRDNAQQSAHDADTAIDLADPKVIADHDACLLSGLIQPVLDCVTNGIITAKNATEKVTSPLDSTVGKLDAIIKAMIHAAAAQNPTQGNSCNEGVQFLADAAQLITDQTGAAQLIKLNGCVSELQTAAPGNSLIASGQAAQTAAQTILDKAHNALFDTGATDVLATWRKRIVCTMGTATINVHVTDESGDDFGDDNAKGAKIEILNFPFSSLLPELTLPVGVADEHGRVPIPSVPLAPVPLPLPTGTPPIPPSLPTPDFAMLQFTASHPGTSATGVTPKGVNHLGIINGGVTVEINIPASSPTS